MFKLPQSQNIYKKKREEDKMKFCTYCDKLSYTSKVTRDGKKIYYCDDHAYNIAVDQDYGIILL